MCGRSSLAKTEKELEERFNSTFYSDDLERYNPLPNFNVAPSHMHPVITNQDPEHFQYFRWGLIPFWAKDQKIGFKMINARIETILEKSAFKSPMQKRRCLVPFDGFYEWKKTINGKIPYRVITLNQEIFCIAGLWEKWKDPQNEDIYSFTLITQPPNGILKNIHNRMPAILLPEQEKLWLDPEIPVADLLEEIKPYPEDMMKAYPVSKKVNSVYENHPDLIVEVHYPEESQGQLF